MEQLQIEKKNALTAFNKADSKGKELLSDLFGKEVFSQKITDRIKTFEDACEALNIDPESDQFDDGSDDDEIAYRKLKVIVRALNEGWTPDWNNGNQYKWSNWFYMNNPGFRFDVSFYDFSGTHTSRGSRLCFSSKELAEYAAKQFLSLYEQFLN